MASGLDWIEFLNFVSGVLDEWSFSLFYGWCLFTLPVGAYIHKGTGVFLYNKGNQRQRTTVHFGAGGLFVSLGYGAWRTRMGRRRAIMPNSFFGCFGERKSGVFFGGCGGVDYCVIVLSTALF